MLSDLIALGTQKALASASHFVIILSRTQASLRYDAPYIDYGQLRPAALKASVVHLHQVGAAAVAESIGRGEPRVAGVEDKPYKRRPAAPFTTSTLQQEASRKLRMNPRETMRVAQGLYENGFITYMRTDSTVLSGQADRKSTR